MKKRKTCVLLLFTVGYLFLMNGSVFAQGEDINLSLWECTDYALRENLDLKVYNLGLQYSALSIIQEESIFDPSISFNVNRDISKTPNYFQYYKVSSIESKTSYANFTLGQSLTNGADWDFGFYNTLSESNIETERNYTSYLGIQFTQPLLQGFGKKINRANIYLARISNDTAAYDLEDRALDLIYEVQNAYWDLVYARETLGVREISLSQADSLLAYNQKGLELGIMIKLDVLEAQSAKVSRQQEILDQRSLIRDYEDVLRRILNITSEDDWNITIVPSDYPTIFSTNIDEMQSLREALKQRPDYKLAQKRLEESEIYIDVTKNSRLPNLDVTARYNLHGSGTTANKDLRDLGNTDAYGWNVGLMLNYPLKNRNAKADYEKSQIERKRALLQIENLESQIMTELRSSIRNVNISREKIDVAQIAVEVNELKLREEEERFRNQLSSSYFVLLFQRDLADARNIYNKALVDYTKAYIEFQRAQGTLLQDLNIIIVPRKN